MSHRLSSILLEDAPLPSREPEPLALVIEDVEYGTCVSNDVSDRLLDIQLWRSI